MLSNVDQFIAHNIIDKASPISESLVLTLAEQIATANLNRSEDAWRGNIMLMIDYPNLINMNPELELNNKDQKIINDWVSSKNQELFLDNKYMLELDTYVILFKYYNIVGKDDRYILYGTALTNNLDTKLTLLEERQKYIMRSFI